MTGQVIHVDFAKKGRSASIEADSAVSADPMLAEIALLLSSDALMPLPEAEQLAPMPAKVSLRDIGAIIAIIEKNGTDAATAMETMRTGSEALAALSARLLEDTKLLAESLQTVSDLIGELALRVREQSEAQAAEG